MTDTANRERPRLDTIHRSLAYLLPVLVFLQAALAGQFLFGDGAIAVHGILGNMTFALAVAGVALALARGCDGLTFGLAVTMMALTFAQVGLGYVGRDNLAAAAWHIPNGVAIFGLSTYQLARLTSVRGARPGR